MQAADPLKVLLEVLPGELYETFVGELDEAIANVCALARNPDQAGATIQALAELIRSWHLTAALMNNRQWAEAMNEDFESFDRAEIGSLEDLQRLLKL
jgi:hypothetical protein